MSFSQKLLVIAIMALALAGIVYVGKKNNDLEEENKKMSYYQTENVYLWYSDETFTDFFNNAAVEFHEQNPDIRVIPTLVSSAEYLEKINEASLEAEDFPDVFLLTNDSIEKAYLSGLATKTNDVAGVLNSAYFGNGALLAVNYRGKSVAYPLSYETSVLLYNKTYLEEWVEKLNTEGFINEEINSAGEEKDGAVIEPEPIETEQKTYTLDDFIPKSFDDISNFADVYHASGKVSSVLKWDVSDIFYNYFFAGKYMIVGGDSGDDTNQVSILNDNTVACLEAYQALNSRFSIDAATASYEDVLTDFLDGKTIYTIVTSDAIKKVDEIVAERAEQVKLQEEADALAAETEEAETEGESEDAAHEDDSERVVNYEFGYANIPDLSDELETRSLSVTNCLVINGYSEAKTAANKFAAFVSTQYAENLYSRTGRLPACKAVKNAGEAFDVFLSEYDSSIPLPKIVETSNLWIQLEIALTDIWQGDNVTLKLKSFEEQIKSQIAVQ